MLRAHALSLTALAVVLGCFNGLGCGGDSQVTATNGTGAANPTAAGGSSAGGNASGGNPNGGAAAAGNTGTGGEPAGGAGGTGAGTGGTGTGGQAQGGNATGGAGGAGGGGDVDDPCTYGASQCIGDLYCDAAGCGAGTCQPKLNIAAQSQTYEPVCGCDGVNYYNPSVAHSLGAAVSHSDTCTALEQVACNTDNAPCAGGLSCSVQVANAGICGPNLSDGVCWGAPTTCSIGAPQARGCIPPGVCSNKCALIRSENGWHDDATCP